MLAKDDAEHPVPPELRSTFHDIADAFAAGDYCLRNHNIKSVCPIDRSTGDAIAKSVLAYGGRLTSLHRSTWDHAIYRWMEGYWQLLVDLTTENEQVSDLTLHAKLSDADFPMMKIESVHVP
jgi:hypothetical protein